MTPPGPMQLLLIVLVVVLLFGAKKLPDLARSVGRSSRILKAELKTDDDARNGDGDTDGATDAAPARAGADDPARPAALPHGDRAEQPPVHQRVTGNG